MIETLRNYFPIFEWGKTYNKQMFASDSLAGLIVAIMLVPQGMAYALLAGLPAEVGLYASIVPLILYGIMGSSRTLAVGPVAIVSLMVASTLGDLAQQGTATYLVGGIMLALLSGLILIGMGLARLGFIVNFLSHPVISGFSSAAALIIGFSQLKSILGFDIPRSHLITETIDHAVTHINQTNLVTLLLAATAFAILLSFKSRGEPVFKSFGLSDQAAGAFSKSGPLVAVFVTTLLAWVFNLSERAKVKVVADIPAGIPPFLVPNLDIALARELLPAATLIAIVGFLESVSVAKSLASKRRQKVDPNQEFIALGAANIGSAFSGGYPVTGGFSRSLVNFTSGAVTPFASIVTAALIGFAVLFLTPLLYHLPKATLAAIIVVAVVNLIDVKIVRQTFFYDKADFTSLLVTFFAVLAIGIELGIIAGAGVSIALYLWRTSRPHVAEVGQVDGTEHFRNINRHEVTTRDDLITLRVDESLYFANAAYLEDLIYERIASDLKIKHVILLCSAINEIDGSALETLETINHRLRDSEVKLHLSEVKGPVMDRLKRSHFLDKLTGEVFLSQFKAFKAIKTDGA